MWSVAIRWCGWWTAARERYTRTDHSRAGQQGFGMLKQSMCLTSGAWGTLRQGVTYLFHITKYHR